MDWDEYSNELEYAWLHTRVVIIENLSMTTNLEMIDFRSSCQSTVNYKARITTDFDQNGDYLFS